MKPSNVVDIHAHSGLLPHKVKAKDYSFHKTFKNAYPKQPMLGAPLLPADMPAEFSYQPSYIDDQGPWDDCTAEASSAAAGIHFNFNFSPEWFFSKEKQTRGNYTDYGAEIRDVGEAGTKYGFLPRELVPPDIVTKGRDFFANWANWPTTLEAEAAKFKRPAYFWVDGPYDIFDNIRSAVWTNRADKECIVIGTTWYAEWTNAGGGLIPETFAIVAGGHALYCVGWKLINGQPYLIIVNSYGLGMGDQGKYYFSRAVVNKCFQNGLLCFKDSVDPNQIKRIGNIVALIAQVVALLRKLIMRPLKGIFGRML